MEADTACSETLPQPLRLIRLAEVKRRTGLSTSTIYRWMRAGKFPQSHRIGGYIAAWSEIDIQCWIHRVVDA
jgi:prophage regulatory protein